MRGALGKPFRLVLLAAVLFSAASILDASDNYTVNSGANQNITAHAECRKVTNNSATNATVYVPTQTAAEWQSFYTNPPAGVTVGSCCAGVSVGGYCWYMGSSGQSCTSVCATRGGYNAATRSYAGSEGTDARCTAVLNALGKDGSPITRGWTNYGIGCGYYGRGIRYAAPYTTTAGATAPGRQRVCACNN
jgi:hypothetical protein